MTPLAHRLAKQLTLPVAQRHEFWRANSSQLASALDDIHCFEITDILPMVGELGGVSEDWFNSRIFAPAPKTWLEFRLRGSYRIALLIEDRGNGWADVTALFDIGVWPVGRISLTEGYWEGSRTTGLVPNEFLDFWTARGADFDGPDRSLKSGEMQKWLLVMCHFTFVIINSPRIIGRRQHMPHRGLERALMKAGVLTGRYPLHAWSELLLEVRLKHVEASGDVVEAHLTGRKCLHFCRAHLRVQNGALVLVNAHWRGDPALGIKRTRYKVAPPRKQAA